MPIIPDLRQRLGSALLNLARLLAAVGVRTQWICQYMGGNPCFIEKERARDGQLRREPGAVIMFVALAEADIMDDKLIDRGGVVFLESIETHQDF